MSIFLLSQVWRVGPDDRGETLILLALADHADDAGRCWPGQSTLARKGRMEPRSVRRVLTKLQAGGWISIVSGGGHVSSRYQININKLAERMAAADGQPDPVEDDLSDEEGGGGHYVRGDTVSAQRGHNVRPERTQCPPRADAGVRGTINNHHKTVNEPSTRAGALARDTEDQLPILSEGKAASPQRGAEMERLILALFKKFYAFCPRKVGPGGAEKAFKKALKDGAHPQVIIEAMRVYGEKVRASGQDMQFVPHPATWLNRRQWEDEEEPEAAAALGSSEWHKAFAEYKSAQAIPDAVRVEKNGD